MREGSIALKVAGDMFWEQTKWTFWLLSIVVVVRMVLIVVFSNIGNELEGFLSFSLNVLSIYMLIIGIVSSYTLSYYVQSGVTRKDYFTGAAMAALWLSAAIAFLVGVLTLVERLILKLTDFGVVIDGNTSSYALQQVGNTVDIDLMGFISGSSFIGQSSHWMVSLFIFGLTIFTSYLIGWLIGAGYYRYGWIIGFGYIALALLSLSFLNILWERELALPIHFWLLGQTVVNFPLYGSIVGTVILIGILLWMIRLTTRKAAIKV